MGVAMNRRLTALFAAVEAVLVAAIGIAIPLVPLTLLWGFQYGLALDWSVFWRAAVDVWLLGHGVDLGVVLDPATAALLGFPGSGDPFTVTIGALGFALLTALLGVRAGRRVAETHHALLGQLISLAAFGALSFGVSWSAVHEFVRPSVVQGTVLPTLVFAVGLLIGVGRTRAQDRGRPGPLMRRVDALPGTVRAVAGGALRGGVAAAAAIVLAATLVTAVAILLSYARIISLYESLHTEVLGGVAVTLGQLAFLPNLVIFTASWLIGPGFALGTGSAVSPLATHLGPIPAIPVLGALPQGSLLFGFIGLLVPVVAGFLAGAILGPGLRRELDGRWLAVTAVGMGLAAGVILGVLAWASGGAAGPGRLVHVGPDPWAVGGFAALEVAVAALVGLFASLRRPREGTGSHR